MIENSYLIKKIKCAFYSFLASLLCIVASTNVGLAQTTPATVTPEYCNTPLVGPGRVINRIGGSIASVLDVNTSLDNLTDGDLSNCALFSGLASVGAGTIVSIKDIKNEYSTNETIKKLRVGFVIELESENFSVLDISLISTSFEIRTYLNGIKVDNSETNKFSLLSANLLSAASTKTGKVRFSFDTSAKFNEVELVQTKVLNASLSAGLKVYYAYVEPDGCNHDCLTPITPGNGYPNASINNNPGAVGAYGINIGTVTGRDKIVDDNLENYGLATMALSLGGGVMVTVRTGTDIPVGSYVGFVVSSPGGLLKLGLANFMSVETYTTEKDNFLGVNQNKFVEASPSGGLLSLSLITTTESKQTIGFTTALPCNEICIRFGSVVGALESYRIHYAFVKRPDSDSDGDGVPDCADKCPGGNDMMDSNGNGIPDDCDCELDLGPDFTVCGDVSGYTFGKYTTAGYAWEIVSQPEGANATVAGGVVSGMSVPGEYKIKVTNTAYTAFECSDEITIRKIKATEGSCGTPIVGDGVITYNPGGGFCLLCLSGGKAGSQNLVDDNTDNSLIVYNILDLVSINNPIAGVKNTSMVYPAGTIAGFVVKNPSGLADISVLNNLQIRTYLNGKLQETSDNKLTLATVNVAGSDLKTRHKVGFLTTKKYDAVVLYSTELLSALSGLEVFYAYQEPQECAVAESLNCYHYLTANSEYKAQLTMNNQGSLLNLLGGSVTNLGNIVNSDPDDYATVSSVASLAAPVIIGVKTPTVIEGGKNIAGFKIGVPAGLLQNVSVLEKMIIRTRLNDGAWDHDTENFETVGLKVLGITDDIVMLSYSPKNDFNEIQLVLATTLVAANAIHVYGAFVSPDRDGDGTPDCESIACNTVDVIAKAYCTDCNVTIDFVVSGTSTNPYNHYKLFEGNTQKGNEITSSNGSFSFAETLSGLHTYIIKGYDGSNYVDLKEITVNVHPAAATWKETVSDATWQNGANWTATTGDGSYPIWCTDVTIPGTTSNFPLLTDGDACRDITFLHGASVGQVHRLLYRKAFVEYTPERTKWTMLSAPLKYIYSADYHADPTWGATAGVDPRIYMMYFDIRYKDEAEGKTNPDQKEGAYQGSFSLPFANLKEALAAGKGFAYQVSEGNNDAFKGTFKFPRFNVDGSEVLYKYHYTSTGNWVNSHTDPDYLPFVIGGNNWNVETYGSGRGTAKPRSDEGWITDHSDPKGEDNRYRFIYENGKDNTVNITVDNAGTTNIVGNPFMSHIDFKAFATDNADHMEAYYRIWDGSKFYSYKTGGGQDDSGAWSGLPDVTTSMETGSQYIAPMQSFLVQMKSGKQSLTFNPDQISTSVTGATLRSSAPFENVLSVELQMNGQTNKTIVAALPLASDAYLESEDIYKLFSFFDEVPEIYTLADGQAIEINAVSAEGPDKTIPLGIKTTQTGRFEITVEGAEHFNAYDKLQLIDTKGTTYDLKSGATTFSFVKNDEENMEGRFYIAMKDRAGTAWHDIETRSAVNVFRTDGWITVSAPDDRIEQIALFDTMGRMRYLEKGEGSYVKCQPNVGPGIYILKLKTTSGNSEFKLIF